jgi:hypothetical protein
MSSSTRNANLSPRIKKLCMSMLIRSIERRGLLMKSYLIAYEYRHGLRVEESSTR